MVPELREQHLEAIRTCSPELAKELGANAKHGIPKYYFTTIQAVNASLQRARKEHVHREVAGLLHTALKHRVLRERHVPEFAPLLHHTLAAVYAHRKNPLPVHQWTYILSRAMRMGVRVDQLPTGERPIRSPEALRERLDELHEAFAKPSRQQAGVRP